MVDWYLLSLFLIPYAFIGNELGNLMVLLVVSIGALLHPKPIKKRSLMVIAFLAWSCISLFILNRWSSGISGFACWFSVLLMAFWIDEMTVNERTTVFKKFFQKLKWLMEFICIANLMGAIIFRWPIQGLLGYENTFALLLALLSIGILFELSDKKVVQKESMHQLAIFLVTLVLTQSKFTIALFLLTLGYMAYNQNRASKKEFNSRSYVGTLIATVGVGFVGIVTWTLFFKTGLHGFETLTERVVVIQDLLSYFKTHPERAFIGSAFDSFQREQYGLQSVYYDLRFIHNSVFQLIFETGMVGFLIVAGMFWKRKFLSPFAGIAIPFMMVHSLFEFDLAFPIFMITLWFGTVSCEKCDKTIENKRIQPTMAMLGLGLSAYMIITLGCVLSGDLLAKIQSPKAEVAYKIAARINPWTVSPKEGLFDLYRQSYGVTGDEALAEACLLLLDEIKLWGAKQGFVEGRILLNEGIMNAKLGREEMARVQFLEGIKSMPFNPSGYKVYQTYLTDTKDQQSVEQLLIKQVELLNPLAKGFPNQIIQ